MKAANRLFVVTLLMLSTAHYLKAIDVVTLVGLITAGITLYIGFLQTRLSDDKIFKELFQTFNERYDKYNDIINECGRDSTRVLSKAEKNLVIDYLNLCAEEYLWYKKGRIPADVWTSWKKGMLYNIDISQVHQVYVEERKQRESYYGLFDELEKK